MLIYDGPYRWDGFGARFKLGSGACRLKIFNLSKDDHNEQMAFMKPIIVIVSDTIEKNSPINKVTVRGFASHIATCVTKDFNLDPARMLWVEYSPPESNTQSENLESMFDLVEFQWFGNKALHPQWRKPTPPILNLLKNIMRKHPKFNLDSRDLRI